MIVNASGLSVALPNNPVVGYQNIVVPSNIAAGTTLAGYPATNLANPDTSALWIGASATLQYLTVTVSTLGTIDYVGIAKHNFGSAAIAVSVEGDTGAGYVQLVAPYTPTDDTPLIFRFAPTVFIGVRVKLAAGSAAPQAAVLYVGALLTFQRRIYVGPAPITYGRSTNIVNGRSESGNFLGRIVLGEQRSTQVSLQNLTPDWYRASMDPFVVAAQEIPFFFAWRPSDYPAEIGFVWLTNDPAPANQRPNGMVSIDLQMAGIA